MAASADVVACAGSSVFVVRSSWVRVRRTIRFAAIAPAVLGKYLEAIANRSGFAFSIILSAGVGPPPTAPPDAPPPGVPILPSQARPRLRNRAAPRNLRLYMVSPEWQRPSWKWSPALKKD